jgi:rhodanese-related sulfurtransferase/predicted metal-dependent enzyme (double-stranded beta helix superfamily)
MSTPNTVLPRPTELADIVSRLVNRPQDWMDRVRLIHDRRWYERLELHDDYDVWLLSWLPGHGTGFHDHGGSSGAFAVAIGSLEEHRPGEQPLTLAARDVRAFGPRYVHDVRNASQAPAVSIHVYSPPLTDMNHYALDDGALRPLPESEALEPECPDGLRQDRPRLTRRYGIGEALVAARRRFGRLSAARAYEETQESGAMLVDIRPLCQRAREGMVPGALVVERNVLEWRFDPASNARLPVVTSYDVRPVLLCSEGYASSLAVASLQEIGLWRATDVIGGFKAWCQAGLPVSNLVDVALPAFETRGEGQR